ncbi:hypothetical protein HK102_002571 [Quaeritorhiza haematococci]|nr:hypothetical protein HK102_002571 [Quaeritorhiza haematococci]
MFVNGFTDLVGIPTKNRRDTKQLSVQAAALVSNEAVWGSIAVQQPAHCDHVGYFSDLLNVLEDEHTSITDKEEQDLNIRKIQNMKDELAIAKKTKTHFGIYKGGCRENVLYSKDGLFYGIDAAVIRLESTYHSVEPAQLGGDTSNTSLTPDFQLKGLHAKSAGETVIKEEIGRSTGVTKGRFAPVPICSIKSNNGFTIYQHQKNNIMCRILKDEVLF